MKRRSFLSSAFALPVIAELLRQKPAYAETAVRHAPYLSLEPFLQPGRDDFPEELEAMRVEAALKDAIQSRRLPLAPGVRTTSLIAGKWKQVSPDIAEAVFANAADKPGSFAEWAASLGEIRRAQFFALPEDKLRYEVASLQDGRLFYTTGQWQAKWKSGELLELSPLAETRASEKESLFRDVTGSVFDGSAAFRDQLSRGIPYWRARLDPASGIDIYGANGIAVGDIDADGSDELFVCQPGGLPNRLFKYRDGRFEDITGQWGLPLLDDTSAALFLDLRNTGRQDLVVLRSSGPLLYLNEGGRFRLQENAFQFGSQPKGGFTGIAAADYDRDGKLDLYLCTYVYFQSEAQYTYPAPYHDAQNGPPNFLFRNRLNEDGSGFFEDMTAQSGMDENNNRFSFAPTWCDTNGDGWPDLYVANDFGRNNFYRNERGRFSDAAASAGIEDMGPGMSSSWFDYDGDGRPDLYVANMWSASGQRVTHNPKFSPAQGPEMAEAYRRHTKGNSLYRNSGDGTFEDTSEPQGVTMGRWAWSSVGYDFDNDGSPEILIGSGMLSNVSRKDDLMSFFWRQVVAHSPDAAQPSPAYENGWNAINQFIREQSSWSGNEPNVFYARRGGRYYDVSGISGIDFAEDTRAFSITDFDGDGRPDIILKSRLGPQVRVLQNNCAEKHHSIAFELRGTKSNRDAIGAKIECNGRAVWLSAESGYLSQHSKRVIVGLGEATGRVDVRVTWPSGGAQQFAGLEPGYTYSMTEGAEDCPRKAFLARKKLASKMVESDNEPRLHTTWFFEPLPLPQAVPGPCLLVLKGGGKLPSFPSLPVRILNFEALPQAQQDGWRIFRRYLFDYRVDLAAPFCMLLDDGGKAVKVYAGCPTPATVQADLHSLKNNSTAADILPFPGLYHNQPHRDLFKFAAALLWEGHTEAALPYLTETLQRGRATPRILMLIGQIHLESGRPAEAENYLKKALALNPEYAEAWSELGAVCEARQDFRQALGMYEKAIGFDPRAAYLLFNAAQAADKLDDAAKAEQYYRRALTIDPKSADAANGLGLLLAKQGKTGQAKALFQQAIELRRNFGPAINNLGVLYINAGQVGDAVAAFEYGLGVAPDEDILYLNLGRIYAQQGQNAKAREVMQRLLVRKPGDSTASRALAELEKRR